jgi:hypothetical protein
VRLVLVHLLVICVVAIEDVNRACCVRPISISPIQSNVLVNSFELLNGNHLLKVSFTWPIYALLKLLLRPKAPSILIKFIYFLDY